MPRKQRIEYIGAIYHVISRGNYRKDLFTVAGSGEAFEQALFEVCERCNWKLHAYVIMSNHYHLALETPEGNLVAGMKWLQGAFATRFNRFTGERGHVFQGRYKSLLIEPDQPLLGLVNYIHLNPVRAKIVTLDNLKAYALSSFPKYFKKHVPGIYDRGFCLGLIDLPDSAAGMRRYHKYLELQDEQDPKRKEELYRKYCRGWIVASKEYKKERQKEISNDYPDVEWEGVGMSDLKAAKWESLLKKELKSLGKNQKDIESSPKGMEWKIKIAIALRTEGASNPWIAKALNMGHPSRVSNLLSNEMFKFNV